MLIDIMHYAAMAAVEENMPVIRITDIYNISGNEVENTYHFFHPTHLPTADDVSDMLGEFRDQYLPVIADIQSDQVTHIELQGYAYNLGYSLSLGVDVDGTVTSGGDLTIASNLAAIVRRNLGTTLLNDGGSVYTGNRPLRRSRIYLGGLPEGFMRADGFDIPAALATEWEAFTDVMEATGAPITVNGFTFYHNAFGFHLDALPASPSFPDGKPERPDVVAPVLTISGVGFTKLKTRRV